MKLIVPLPPPYKKLWVFFSFTCKCGSFKVLNTFLMLCEFINLPLSECHSLETDLNPFFLICEWAREREKPRKGFDVVKETIGLRAHQLTLIVKWLFWSSHKTYSPLFFKYIIATKWTCTFKHFLLPLFVVDPFYQG